MEHLKSEVGEGSLFTMISHPRIFFLLDEFPIISMRSGLGRGGK